MNKKKKVFVFLTIIFIIILLVIIAIVIDKNKSKTSIDDFSSIKELVEYDGHKYITMKNSEEQDFYKDIYILFSKPTINDDGTTNQRLYEILISHISGKLKGKNFRIIDEDRNIIIKVISNEDETISYTINDDAKYWEHIKTNYEIENPKEENNSSFTITSQLLANIINNDWIYNNINLGTKDSSIKDYEIYFDEGYKIRKIGSKIFNIIFTSKYNNEILKDIYVQTSKEEIKNILGNPTYSDENTGIIGYRCQYFYIFFSNNEISIYPIDKYNEEESKKFGNLVTELNKTGDINTFLNKLTDLYPDYDNKYTDENNITITYSLRGFEVDFGKNSKNNGIKIYSNFQGNITDDKTIEDIKNSKQIPANVYTNLDQNLVFKTEISRYTQDDFYRNPYDNIELLKTDEYSIMSEQNRYLFYSRNKENIDSQLVINDFTNILKYNEYTFIYGVKNVGIFMYNSKTLEKRQLLEGEGNFNIEKIENDIIYYDGKQIKI